MKRQAEFMTLPLFEVNSLIDDRLELENDAEAESLANNLLDDGDLRIQLERLDAVSHGWALSCCSHERAEAEDVLQNAYLKVLRKQARYEGKSSFKTWLFSVIRRTAMEERRRRWLRHLGLAKYMHERESQEVAVDHVDASDNQAAMELRHKFHAGLGRLPRRQKEVLHLVFYQDLSIQEAAEVMCVSVGSARKHYERGKQGLRKWLKGVETSGVMYEN